MITDQKVSMGDKYLVIDFDSTFSKVESLDILCEIAQKDNPDSDKVLQKIVDITNLGMEGTLSLRESLEERIKILGARRGHLGELIERLKNEISESFKANKDFILKNADKIIILSNGFKDFIAPVVKEYGIKESNVYANDFTFDEDGNINGINKENLLSSNNGKPKQIKALGLEGDIYMIGDGYNDYEVKKMGAAHCFLAYTENITRESVVKEADHVVSSFDEVLTIIT